MLKEYNGLISGKEETCKSEIQGDTCRNKGKFKTVFLLVHVQFLKHAKRLQRVSRRSWRYSTDA